MKKCDICQKNMQIKNGEYLIGCQFVYHLLIDGDEKELKKQFGNFSYKKEYYMCCECYLKKLGFKEEIDEN